jgi:cytoskeletal protein CcmA (bactofilin family)
MMVEHGQVPGPLVVTDDYVLHGMVSGDAVVARGGYLELLGMVTGDLRVEDGGSAKVRGIVSKNVLNAGTLEVYGIIVGRLSSTPEASSTIVPGSQINGVTQ